MKKIRENHSNKDRIICVSDIGKHKFYFQPVDSKDRLWLFDTKNYSGSVFTFFRKYGRNIDGIGFSMTVKELYEVGNNNNVKINKILDRVPAQIEYVLREQKEFVLTPCIGANSHNQNYDFNRVA